MDWPGFGRVVQLFVVLCVGLARWWRASPGELGWRWRVALIFRRPRALRLDACFAHPLRRFPFPLRWQSFAVRVGVPATALRGRWDCWAVRLPGAVPLAGGMASSPWFVVGVVILSSG